MNSVASQLTRDHQELHALLRGLAQDARAPLPGMLQSTWTTFENRLLRHMETEEQCLLPLIEGNDPKEVIRIRTEHARIRNVLSELGIAIELHTVREANINELIVLLETHAKHENTALYRLAEDRASSDDRIAQLIKHGVAAAAAAVSGKLAERKTSGRRKAASGVHKRHP